MKVCTDYVHQYGNTSYEELPFRTADTFVLCNVIYAPIEKAVGDGFLPAEDAKTLAQAIDDFYDYFDRKVISCGFVLTAAPFLGLLELKNYPRYADLKVTGCRFVLNKTDTSFLGISFLLGDDTLLVFFRGTDDTIVGWLEDVDIFAKESIPSQKLCIDYLNEAAAAYPDRKIIVAGHSKGGYLALYSALFCKPEVRSRIVQLYNHDGPGDKNYAWIETAEFEQLAPVYHHFVPGKSMFGMMLCHDDNYKIVKSNRFFAPFQHDISSWGIEDTEPLEIPELEFMGKMFNFTFRDFLTSLDPERTPKFYDAILAILFAPAEETLLGVTSHPVASVRDIVKAAAGLSKDHKKALRSLGGEFVSFAGKAAVRIAKETGGKIAKTAGKKNGKIKILNKIFA